MEVTDSNPTRIRIATQAWMKTKLKLCGPMTDFAVGWKLKVVTFVVGSVV